MNIMNQVTWRAMWKNKVRTIVTIIGVILSAAMFTAVTTLGISCLNYLMDIAIYDSGDYFIKFDYGSDEDLEALRREETVADIGDIKTLGYTTFPYEDETLGQQEYTCIVAAGDETFFDMVSIHLSEGRLPENSSEIVLTDTACGYLSEAGLPSGLGDTVTLDLFRDYQPKCYDIPTGSGTITNRYTIVGIVDDNSLLMEDWDVNLNSLVTFADGGEGDAIWHRFYVKTTPASAAYDLENGSHGCVSSLNYGLLNLYGASKYANYNRMIYAVCAVLIGIIMVGSVSLIYNAFSISVSERTKQFGLLSSVGATKKQLRKSVYFEALALSAMGIPIGILCGYGGIAVTLYLLRDMMATLFAASEYVAIRAVPSAAAFLAAGAVSVLTVMISARIPARRATKVAPIAAIRQTQDYQLPKKEVRAGKWSTRIWGLPGLMAKKYYAASKKKYRTTVISLTVSVVLFLAVTSFGGVLQTTAEEAVNTNNFDLACYYLNQEQVDEIRALPGVSKCMLRYEDSWSAVVDDGDLSEEYRQIAQITGYVDTPCKSIVVYYMENEAFRAYCEANGIDAESYFDAEGPGLVCNANLVDYRHNEKGEYIRNEYYAVIFNDSADALTTCPTSYPLEVEYAVDELMPDTVFYPHQQTLNGHLVWVFQAEEEIPLVEGEESPYVNYDISAVFVAAEQAQDENGNTVYSYYFYDSSRDELAESPICIEPAGDLPTIRIGAQIGDLPYGVPSNTSIGGSQLVMVMPLSRAGEVEPKELDMIVSVSDYQSVTDWLNQQEIVYMDYLDSEYASRNMIFMVNVFSYGFIILISLICVCNVFNTISTNIALRRRDFGMLRSVGMKTGELYRMMIFECLRYGLRALLFGLPLGLMASYGIHLLTDEVTHKAYSLPLPAIAVATGSVFVVVFISMFYAVSKLKKDNPIEAIRTETT